MTAQRIMNEKFNFDVCVFKNGFIFLKCTICTDFFKNCTDCKNFFQKNVRIVRIFCTDCAEFPPKNVQIVQICSENVLIISKKFWPPFLLTWKEKLTLCKFLLSGCMQIICKNLFANLVHSFPKSQKLLKSDNWKWVKTKI